MPNKKYSISELINENISLKKRLEKLEKENLKNLINILELIKNNKNIDLDKVIEGFKIEYAK